MDFQPLQRQALQAGQGGEGAGRCRWVADQRCFCDFHLQLRGWDPPLLAEPKEQLIEGLLLGIQLLARHIERQQQAVLQLLRSGAQPRFPHAGGHEVAIVGMHGIEQQLNAHALAGIALQ